MDISPLFHWRFKSWYCNVIFYRKTHYYLESWKNIFSHFFNSLAIFSDISFTHLLWNFGLRAQASRIYVYNFFVVLIPMVSTLSRGPGDRTRVTRMIESSDSWVGWRLSPHPGAFSGSTVVQPWSQHWSETFVLLPGQQEGMPGLIVLQGPDFGLPAPWGSLCCSSPTGLELWLFSCFCVAL